MPGGPKNLRVSFAGRTLKHFGRLVLFHRFVQRLGLRTVLGRRVWFSQRNNHYSVGESLLGLLYPVILGLGRIETTHLLRRNGVFQYLTGLPAYPDPQTLRRFLLRFAEEGWEHLVRLHDEPRTTLLQQPTPPRSVIFDLNSTVLTVYGRQKILITSPYHPPAQSRGPIDRKSVASDLEVRSLRARDEA